MEKILASIDIGSHTARLLVAKVSDVTGVMIMQPLARKRAYIRLAESFNHSGNKIIQSHAIHRAMGILQDFSGEVRRFNVHSVHAVATGVVREAGNAEWFLDRVLEKTGIRVRPISGVEEALFTAKGVLRTWDMPPSPFVVFDLGGASTELFLGRERGRVARSVPIGAMTLKKKYLRSDPPEEAQIDALSGYIDRCLKEANPDVSAPRDRWFVIGTGGTVTTLAVMLNGIFPEEITPERVNGLVLVRREIEALSGEIRNLSLKEIRKLPLLDEGRADVILAGCLAVIKILHFYGAQELAVSFSDLLEGILFAHLEGEDNDKKGY
jgi:exopolyphosphatase/guanosine-5'-triphosphate,3'-diphosphate pyrophosphatase